MLSAQKSYGWAFVASQVSLRHTHRLVETGEGLINQPPKNPEKTPPFENPIFLWFEEEGFLAKHTLRWVIF